MNFWGNFALAEGQGESFTSSSFVRYSPELIGEIKTKLFKIATF